MFEACAWALLIVASNVTRRGEEAWRVTSPLPSSRDRTVSTVACAAGSSNVAWMVRALIGVPVLDRACITSASSAPAERDLTPGIPSPSVRAAAVLLALQRRRAGRTSLILQCVE